MKKCASNFRNNFHYPLGNSGSYRLISGFSLVEIMVAVVIGMLGIIVMMQVFASYEGQKRTTSGGDDAQNAGAIALYQVQRDIRQAGYGLNAFKLIGCNVTLPETISSNVKIPFVPVRINPPGITGDAHTDTVMIVMGGANGAPEGSVVTAQLLQNNYTVDSIAAFLAGDMVVAEPTSRPTTCDLTMEQLTAVVNPNVSVATGVTGMLKGTLYNFGQLPKIRVYRVWKGVLTVCDYWKDNCADASSADNAAVWAPIGDGIVSMRAQYGSDISVPMDGAIDLYNQELPTTSSSDNCNLLRVSALRIVLVAKNGQPEKTEVTTAPPLWRGSVVSATDAVPPVNGESLAINLDQYTDWKYYRYKIFQTVIPLRNITSVVKEGKSAGC